jgi:hydroxyacylglutathione hydrolase
MLHCTVLPVVDDGLGNSAYVVDTGDGRAILIDPSIDVRAVERVVHGRRLTVSHVFETHLHADFVSAAHRYQVQGVVVAAPGVGGRLFPHLGLMDGSRTTFGDCSLEALATPGHAPDHFAYVLRQGPLTIGVFTGGSLLVGGVARTDLHGEQNTSTHAREQFRSLQRLKALPDSTVVYPTHGAGSFCSAPVGAARTSSIAQELLTNPMFQSEDEDEFVALLLGRLGSYPPYFRQLPEVNRSGAEQVVTEPGRLGLDPVALGSLLHSDSLIIDVRRRARFATSHLPGSLAIPLRPAFGTWLGWLVSSSETPLVIIHDEDQDPSEVAWQCAKVGFRSIVGYVPDGLAAWTDAGGMTNAMPLRDASDCGDAVLVDVRQASEFSAGHVPGAMHIELGALSSRASELADLDLVIMCAVGDRAASAASILARAGSHSVAFVSGGPGDWAAGHAGRRLEVTPSALSRE